MIQYPVVGQGSRLRVRIPAHRFFRLICATFILFVLADTAAYTQDFSGFTSRQGELKKNRIQIVSDVTISGNENIETLLLLPKLATKPSSWIDELLNSINSSIGLPEQVVSLTNIASDTETIYLLYREQGYLDAKVTYSLIEDSLSVEEWMQTEERNRLLPQKDKEDYPKIETTVAFIVTEGRRLKVGGFTFEGLEDLPTELLDKATSEIGIKLNTPYSESAVRNEYKRVETFLQENGYPFFTRDSAITERFDSSTRVVTTIYFNTGNRFKLGEITITYEAGSDMSSVVSKNTIERLLTCKTGEWYQYSKIVESEKNLYQLGTFDAAQIVLDTSVLIGIPAEKRDGMSLPVFVGLRMRPTADFAVGVAVTSGSVGTAVSPKAAYNNRNFFGGGENFAVSSSYQVFPPSQISWDISGSLGLPYIGFTNVPVQIGLSVSRFAQFKAETDSMQLDINSLSLPITTRLNLFEVNAYRSTLGLGASFERISSEVGDSTLIADFEQISKDPQLNLIFSADLIVDGTNDIFNPSKGSSFSWATEVGTPFFAGVLGSNLPSASYWKNTFQIRNFLSVAENGSVFASRLYYGHAILNDTAANRDVPTTRKYLGGGLTSFRGWSSRSLLVSNIGTGTIIGGYTTIGGSFEFRFAPFQYDVELTTWQQLAAPVRLAFFADLGNVWDKETPILLKNFTITTGLGFRYNTPFGPLRIDWGFKFYDPYYCLNSQESFPTTAEPMWIFRRQFNWKTLFDMSSIGFTIGNAF